MKTEKANSVHEYLESFPNDIQIKLNQIRDVIKQAAPNAEESISYGIPAYKLYKKPLIYFAGYKNYIGFYATPAGNNKFKSELSRYKQGKGSVQFPLNEEIPLDLIFQIIKFKVEDNTQK